MFLSLLHPLNHHLLPTSACYHLVHLSVAGCAFGVGSLRVMTKCVHAAGAWCAFAVCAILLLSSTVEGFKTITDASWSCNSEVCSRQHPEPWMSKNTDDDGLVKVIHATGSSLPDCSHACGPCFPCRRVIVSSKCSMAEPCPMVYRCMCKGKFYHVPSN